MTQKFILLATESAYQSLVEDPRLIGADVLVCSLIDDRSQHTRIIAVTSQHYHLRFDLEKEDGLTVLPGMHDPEPIGDLHKCLSHVNAEPHHTMRQIALRLHEAHGPAFHPDT